MELTRKFSDISFKKILIQLYFIFFIFLNIIDFLNLIGGDLDFFKKILSWIVIGYIFYKVSFTKIFIGERLKIYDFFFIIAFSLMSIVKSMILYTKINVISSTTYPIFNFFLSWIASFNETTLLMGTFFFGLIFAITLSIALLLNYNTKEDSFIGSFNIKEGYFKFLIEEILLLLCIIFFGIIVFNFFMEWFALAVDSIILVLGLVYYLFVFVHNHFEGKVSTYFKNVSKSGEHFFKKLILLFSNKKTFFVAVAFLLSLHLLVDAGVFMVPYTIGTQNELYFDSLDTGGRDHISLFSIANFSNSQFSKELNIISNNANLDFFTTITILVTYFTNIFFMFSIMILPFYIYYKNIQNKEIISKKIFSVLFLSSTILYLLLFIFSSNAISIGFLKSSDVKGVDVYTNSILASNMDNSLYLLMGTIIFLLTALLLTVLYDKIKPFLDKLIYFIVIGFFLVYISIFATSTLQVEFKNLKEDFLDQSIRFNNVMDIHNNNPDFVWDFRQTSLKNITIEPTIFTDSSPENPEHKEYILLKLSNIDYNKYYLRLENITNFYFGDKQYDKLKLNNSNYILYLKEDNFDFVYYIGQDILTFRKNSQGDYSIDNTQLNNILASIIKVENSTSVSKSLHLKNNLILSLMKTTDILRLIFLSMFYLFGSFAFSLYYIKNNLLNNQNQNQNQK